jgi:hypothetical protein
MPAEEKADGEGFELASNPLGKRRFLGRAKHNPKQYDPVHKKQAVQSDPRLVEINDAWPLLSEDCRNRLFQILKFQTQRNLS